MRHLAHKAVEIVTLSAALYRELALSALQIVPMLLRQRAPRVELTARPA